jgi:hypothetical protein
MQEPKKKTTQIKWIFIDTEKIKKKEIKPYKTTLLKPFSGTTFLRHVQFKSQSYIKCKKKEKLKRQSWKNKTVAKTTHKLVCNLESTLETSWAGGESGRKFYFGE